MKARMLINFQTIIMVILTSVAASSAYAQSTSNTADDETEKREYDIELIIFEDTQARYLYSENWQPKPEINRDLNAEMGIQGASADAADDTEIKREFSSLDTGILAQQYKRLGLSSEVNVLVFTAWRQPGLDADKAFTINLDELNNRHTPTSENTVSGDIKVVLGRYLHVHLDLVYTRPGDAITTAENTYTNIDDQNTELELTPEIRQPEYPFKAKRRMRSKELHYIDHPLVGVLVKIMPVEKAKEYVIFR